MSRRRGDPESCWFCRRAAGHGHKVPEPDGKPLCERCKAQLSDFYGWLQARVLF